MKNPDQEYTYSIFRPGGNDTCLINGTDVDSALRKRLNDQIMKDHPNVEQVGFVANPDDPQLVMAGGEFCGNATRSAAYKYLNGCPGELKLRVSGVNSELRAGVSDTAEAWAQMPVYPDLSKIQRDLQREFFFTVEMEGMTHCVVFEEGIEKELENERIKENAAKILRERELDLCPAAGVIYVRSKKNGWEIVPVVHVKSISTFFLETACGSGTTALGLVLAKKNKQSITHVPIMQPSGHTIKVSVNYSEDGFQYAEIRGVVEELGSGSISLNQLE